MNALMIVLIIVGVILLGLAILFLESFRELHRFRVREYEVSLPGSPKGRILFLSDYHEAVGGKLNERLLAKAAELRPDVILIGGDMVNGIHENEDTSPAEELINGLAGIAPVYQAFGNHERRMMAHNGETGYDWEGYVKRLDPSIRFLTNESVKVPLPVGEIRLYGLDMEYVYFRKKGERLTVEVMDRYLGKAEKETPVVLLAHDPSWGKVYSDWGADLTLAGHYHGGIIRLPLIGGFVSPKMDLFPHYDYGVYQEGENQMLVSSGLGQHTIPVRFNNLPELCLIVLR